MGVDCNIDFFSCTNFDKQTLLFLHLLTPTAKMKKGGCQKRRIRVVRLNPFLLQCQRSKKCSKCPPSPQFFILTHVCPYLCHMITDLENSAFSIIFTYIGSSYGAWRRTRTSESSPTAPLCQCPLVSPHVKFMANQRIVSSCDFDGRYRYIKIMPWLF